MEKKSRLGRGLDSLLSNGPNHGEAGPSVAQAEVSLDQIQHNPYQPRKTFDDEELAALSNSIRTHGVLQPLVVRQVGNQYQLDCRGAAFPRRSGGRAQCRSNSGGGLQ